jgi:hypothetical protein
MDLQAVQSEYEEWKDNMPDSLQNSPTYEKLEEIVGLDLSEQSVDDVIQVLDDAMNVELPRGFGRD